MAPGKNGITKKHMTMVSAHADTLQEDVDISQVSKPTPASIGPKDLLNVKVAAPKRVCC